MSWSAPNPPARPAGRATGLRRGKAGQRCLEGYDVVVAGISLVTNYRETFAQEVRNGGIDGLITTLADKNKQVDAKNEKKS